MEQVDRARDTHEPRRRAKNLHRGMNEPQKLTASASGRDKPAGNNMTKNKVDNMSPDEQVSASDKRCPSAAPPKTRTPSLPTTFKQPDSTPESPRSRARSYALNDPPAHQDPKI